MLVATRDINCFGKMVRAGEPIPTPEKWDPIVLHSNMNIGWVKEANEQEIKAIREKSPAAPASAKPKSATNEKNSELRCCGRDFKNKRALSVHSRSHR